MLGGDPAPAAMPGRDSDPPAAMPGPTAKTAMKASPRAEASRTLLRAALARPIRKGRGSSSVGSDACAGGAGRTWGRAELRRGAAATGTGGASAPDDGASSDGSTALLQVPSGAGAAGEQASSPSKLKAHGASSSGPGRRVRGVCARRGMAALRVFAIALLATLLTGTVLAKVDPGAWASLGSALGMPSRGVANVRLAAPGKASLRGASGEGGRRGAALALQQRAADTETVIEESLQRETTEEAAEADLLRAVAAGAPNHVVGGVGRALPAGGHSSNNAQRREET